MIQEAIILAGGFGTRLKSVVHDVPKSMALIQERPFLEYLFDYLIGQGIQKLILSTGYKSEHIRNHFKTQYKNIPIVYSNEESPLGTGGAIKKALDHVESAQVVVTNGDTIFLGRIPEQYQFHIYNHADATIALKRLEDCARYGTVEINDSKRITGFREKMAAKQGLINAGLYILNRNIFESMVMPDKFSIEQDFFANYCDNLLFYGYEDGHYFLDIGIPEDYERAQNEFANLFGDR